jgi:hypothetical protein
LPNAFFHSDYNRLHGVFVETLKPAVQVKDMDACEHQPVDSGGPSEADWLEAVGGGSSAAGEGEGEGEGNGEEESEAEAPDSEAGEDAGEVEGTVTGGGTREREEEDEEGTVTGGGTREREEEEDEEGTDGIEARLSSSSMSSSCARRANAFRVVKSSCSGSIHFLGATVYARRSVIRSALVVACVCAASVAVVSDSVFTDALAHHYADASAFVSKVRTESEDNTEAMSEGVPSCLAVHGEAESPCRC